MIDLLRYVLSEAEKGSLPHQDAIAIVRRLHEGTEAHATLHPLVQQNTSNMEVRRFTTVLGGSEFFLRDHRVHGQATLPCAAHLEMAREAVCRALDLPQPVTDCIELQQVVFERPICVRDLPCVLHIQLEPAADGSVAWQIRGAAEAGAVVHSHGRARRLARIEPETLPVQALDARCRGHAAAPACHAAFARDGLSCGDTFRGLQDVRIGHDEQGAEFVLGRVALPDAVRASHADYVLHPSLAEAAIHTGFVLPGGGHGHEGRAMMPFAIEQVRVHGALPARLVVRARYSPESGPPAAMRRLDLDIADDAGAVRVEVRGFAARPVPPPAAGADAAAAEPDAAIPLPTLSPGPDLLLGRLLWNQFLLLGLFAQDRTDVTAWRQGLNLSPALERWMDRSLRILAEQGYLEGADNALAPSAPLRVTMVRGSWDVYKTRTVTDPVRRPQLQLLDVTLQSLQDILTGRRRAADVMFPDGSTELVDGLHRNNPVTDHFNTVLARRAASFARRRLAEAPRSRLRILEIGAGAGGASAPVFEALAPLASHIDAYTYTDVSGAFLPHAQRRFRASAAYLATQVFDVEHPPQPQGLQPHSYDAVIAARVLHATRDLRAALRHVRALLRPGGVLLINEQADADVATHLTLGLLDGWWRFEDPELRIAGSPLLSPDMWSRLLLDEGFEAVDLAASDAHHLGQQVIEARTRAPVAVPVPRDVPPSLVQRNLSDLRGLRFASQFDGDEPFLQGHASHRRPSLPAAVLLEMAREAATRVMRGLHPQGAVIGLENVSFGRLDRPAAGFGLEVWLEAEGDASVRFEIGDGGPGAGEAGSPLQASGRAVLMPVGTLPGLDLDGLRARCGPAVPGDVVYAGLETLGHCSGPGLRALANWRTGHDGDGHAFALGRLDPAPATGTLARIEAALHAAWWLRMHHALPVPQALASIESMIVAGDAGEAAWVHVHARDVHDPRLDVDIADDTGRVAVRLVAVRGRTGTPAVDAGAAASSDVAVQAMPPTVAPLDIEAQQARAEDLDLLLARLLWGQLVELGLFDGDGDLGRWKARIRLPASYERWLQHSLKVLQQHGLVGAEPDGVTLPMRQLWLQWARYRRAARRDPQSRAMSELLDATLKALGPILAGRKAATQVLFPGGSRALVEGLDRHDPVADHFNEVLAQALVAWMRERARREPRARLRLLEIGTGSGRLTTAVLQRLAGHGQRIQEYCCTDVSRSSLQDAQRRHGAGAPYLRTRLFDVQEPPQVQGLEPGAYDVVIAHGVLHAARDVREALRNARALLKTSGLLLIDEPVGASLVAHLTFGLQPGWWMVEDEALRVPGSPALAPERWAALLQAEGFCRIEQPAQAAHGLGRQIIVATDDTLVRPVHTGSARPALARPVARQWRTAEAVPEPVAIIGVSGCFPLAADVAAFWDNLREGRDCIGQMGPERWQASFSADGRFIRHAGVLEGVDRFDPLFFGISPREAQLMDPQQRLLMMQVWKVLEDAGYAAHQVAGTDTALFVGTAASGYGRASLEAYGATGAAASAGVNRMSRLLDLRGPSEPVETACSSALVAIHRGVQAIRSGQSRMAIVGGVNTLVSADLQLSFARAGLLSPDGRCRAFGSGANGTVRGEGAGLLMLKSLADAERDGDPIHALIRGTAQSHGGRANPLDAPDPRVQAELIKAALRQSGVDPASVGYLEAHGAGTALGDPVEVQGVQSAFAELARERGQVLEPGSCGIGSVKSNIGHLELAAGAAGVIKVLLQFRHRTLVKSLHSDEPNPRLRLDGSPFYIVQQAQEWKARHDAAGREQPRRAGVSAFGSGGVNAHVVLEEYVSPMPVRRPPEGDGERPAVVVLSARNEERLMQQARQLLGEIQRQELPLRELAYTLQVGREPMEARLACVVPSMQDLRDRLGRYLRGERGIEGIHRGTLRRGGDAPPAAAAKEEPARALHAWMAKGRLDQLAGSWVRGAPVPWDLLYGRDRPGRISLPTYPFAGERYWMPSDEGDGATPTATSHGNARPVLLQPVWSSYATLPGADVAAAPDGRHVVSCGVGFGADHERALRSAWPGCGWLCLDAADDANLSLVRRYTRCAMQLLAFTQELLQATARDPLLVQLVVPVEGEGSVLGGLGAMLRSAAQENPRLRVQVVGVDAGTAPDDLVACLESSARSHAPALRHRGGTREQLVLQSVATSTLPRRPWKDGGVYLLTGGAGGPGLLCAQAIASHASEARVVLAGRRREAPVAALDVLRSLGARVEYCSVDIGDAGAVAAMVSRVREQHGGLDGIVHAAGEGPDDITPGRGTERLLQVLASKVEGLVALDEATRDLELDFFVLSSSMGSLLGQAGRADDAAANAFMDAYAALRNDRVRADGGHGRLLSINWGAWADGVMPVVDGSAQRLWQRAGLLPLQPADAVQALCQAMELPVDQVLAFAGNAQRLLDSMCSAPTSPRATAAQAADPASAMHDAHGDARSRAAVRHLRDLFVRHVKLAARRARGGRRQRVSRLKTRR